MNKVKILIAVFVASMALTACNRYDNPIPEPEQPPVEIENPSETETDQPAYAPEI